ncbi:MAG: uracil-DNA glycosylase family protein [Planctomycetota bacterium]
MDSARAQRLLRQHLRTDQLLGLDAVPTSSTPTQIQAISHVSDTPPTVAPAPASKAAVPKPAAQTSAVPPRLTAAPPPIDLDPALPKDEALARLREHLAQDDAVLAKLMPGTQLVFGEGDPNAEIMFIGEGAGADEARTGRPFVGKTGQLLDQMIKAMGLAREQVYITNVVHFQPPGNRVPTPDEVDLGWPYMIGQVQIVRPKVIVAVGGTSAKALLNTTTGITRLRGQWKSFDAVQPAIPLMPTFHPAFLLRSYTRENRGKVWNDLLAVLSHLGKEPPKRN